MPTPRTTLWSQRHQHWLRHLEQTGAPTIRFERPHGPRLRVLPDWSRPLPLSTLNPQPPTPPAPAPSSPLRET